MAQRAYLYIYFVNTVAHDGAGGKCPPGKPFSGLLLWVVEKSPRVQINNQSFPPHLCVCEMHPQTPLETQPCLSAPSWKRGAGDWWQRKQAPPEGVQSAPHTPCAERTDVPAARWLLILSARLGGEVHVSGGSCLFIIVVAPKWSRQGNT